jgi:hypothetical protein
MTCPGESTWFLRVLAQTSNRKKEGLKISDLEVLCHHLMEIKGKA